MPASTTIGPLKRGNILINSARERAAELNMQFTSVFSSPTEKIDYCNITTNSTMNYINIDVGGVHKQLRSLDPYKACGPDGISSRVIRELADVLALPLTNLFNSSLEKGVVPSDWKKAMVCPIFKKGDKSVAANYRPVSLTCVISKVMEHIISS